MNSRVVPIKDTLEVPPIDQRPLDHLGIAHVADTDTPLITLLIARSRQKSSAAA